MNDIERRLRVDLAACYRIFDDLGWAELIFNHITVKLPGDKEHFLINPYGLHYSEVTASNLLKVDIDGNKVEESEYNPNPAGMIIHSAVHAAREDAVCIAHVHTTAGMAVACQQGGLRHDNFYSTLLYNRVAYHDFEGITVMPGEQPRLVESLGKECFLILRNHGLLVCGTSISSAFLRMWLLNRACEVQVATDATGVAQIPISTEIGEKAEELIAIQMGAGEEGAMEFAALKRKLDARGADYNDL